MRNSTKYRENRDIYNKHSSLMDICIMIQLNMNIMVHLKDFSQPRLPLIDQAINTDIIHAVGNYIGENSCS